MTPAVFARHLSASVGAGLSPRIAVGRLARELPDDPEVTSVSRRVALGASVPAAVRCVESWGVDALVLASVLEISERTGGDLREVLGAMASELENRDGAGASAAMHAAGVTMSARLVALLPVLFVPLTVGTNTDFLDATGVTLLTVGAGLVLAGYRWLMRLVPRPAREPDLAVTVALVLAAGLKAGASPIPTLRAASAIPCLQRVDRTIRLGTTWPEALVRSAETGLVELGEAAASADELGLPLAGTLDDFRAARRAALQRAFETDIRKAPVKMVIPLTTCILPAFALLGAAPFLRSLAGL